jgi:arsenate reductase-like glutaredoxin family protein
LRELGVEAVERDCAKAPLTEPELDTLIGAHDPKDFLRPGNATFRAMDLAEHPPARKKVIELIAGEPDLLRRPLLAVGDELLFGFKEPLWREALSKATRHRRGR